MYHLTKTIIVSLSAAAAGVQALPGVHRLPTRDTNNTFSLFAYGSNSNTDIGGFPILFDNGLAYIANPAKMNHTGGFARFTRGAEDTTQWLASPLVTTSLSAAWAGSVFYVPSPSGPAGSYKKGTGDVTGTTGLITTGFSFYGTTAVVKIDGSLYTEWYAVETGVDGVWSLGWNATGAGVADAELLTVRRVGPTNVGLPSSST